MKAILEFDLDNPGEESKFKLSSNALQWALVVWEMDQYLRKKIKYENKEELAIVREELHDIINSQRVSLEDIE